MFGSLLRDGRADEEGGKATEKDNIAEYPICVMPKSYEENSSGDIALLFPCLISEIGSSGSPRLTGEQ